MAAITNILTFDVEDWFHILEIGTNRDWGTYPSRVFANTRKILNCLAVSHIKATFFILGWIAERFPRLVSEIDAAGHEIASHGYWHQLVYRQEPEEFRSDLRRSIGILETITGKKVLGYRAASFSITEQTPWVFQILAEEGCKYDSSIFPAKRLYGGLARAPRFIYQDKPTGIYEIPISVIEISKIRIPFASGGYFRLFPYFFINQALKRINRRRHPAIVILHPREFDPGQPHLSLPFYRKFLCYINIDSAKQKLRGLLKKYRFAPAREVLGIG
jgi:polysaccharide deacetylase family protein (PEP-CTERM system associated)